MWGMLTSKLAVNFTNVVFCSVGYSHLCGKSKEIKINKLLTADHRTLFHLPCMITSNFIVRPITHCKNISL